MIADHRATLGWSRSELARRVGMSEAAVRKWEDGRAPPPPWLLPWLETLASFVLLHPAPV